MGVRFLPSGTAQVASVGSYLAQQPPGLGHWGRPQRAQIGRPVSSSFSRHAAFPCQPAALGCGTDPIRTAQTAKSAGEGVGRCGAGGWRVLSHRNLRPWAVVLAGLLAGLLADVLAGVPTHEARACV